MAFTLFASYSFFNCKYCKYFRKHFISMNLCMVFSPPPLDVHAFKDYLTTSKMWVVLSIPPPTYGMGNNKQGKKKLKKVINL